MFRLKLPDDADADPADVLDVDSQADSPVGDTPDSAERNNNCEVCLIEPRNPRLALVPCGHQRFCSMCANRVRDEGHGCPICKRHQLCAISILKELNSTNV